MGKCNYIYNGKKYTEKQIMKLINEGIFFPSLTSELQNVADMLGIDVSEIEIVKGLIDGDAVGLFVEDGKILISELAGSGIVYHEAFHKVFQTYLTNEQRKDLLDQVKEKDLTYLRTIYPELSVDRLKEEFLAEEFREYALNEGKLVTVRSGVWEKMLNFLEKLIDLFSSSYGKKRLYSNIKKGAFKGRKPKNYKAKTMKAKVKLSSVFTNKQAHEIMQNVRYTLALELTKTINGDSLDWDLNKVNDLIKGRISNSNINVIIDNVIDSTLTELDEIDPSKSEIFEQYIINHKGDFIEEIIPILEEFKLSVDFSDDIDVDNVDGGKDSFSYKASFESDEKEKMSGFVKMILSTVPKLDKRGNILTTEELGLNYATPLSEILPQMYNLAAKLPSYMIIPAFANSSSKPIQRLKSLFESNDPQWHSFKADLIRTFNNTRHRFTIVNLKDGAEQVVDSNRNTVGKMLEARFKTILSDLLTKIDLEKFGNKTLFNVTDSMMALSGNIVHNSLTSELNKAIGEVFPLLIQDAINRDNPKEYLMLLVNKSGIGTITNILKKQEEFEKNNSMSVTSLTGKKLQEISLHNNMSIMLGFAERLAKADSTMTDIWYDQIEKIDSLIQLDTDEKVDKKMTILRHEFPQLFRVSTSDLHWVKKIKESMTGGKYIGPELNIFLGTSFNSADVETNDMELNDLAYSDIIAFKQGFHLGMKHGDRSTYFGFRNVNRFNEGHTIEQVKEIYEKETATMFLDFTDEKGFSRKDTQGIKPDLDSIVKSVTSNLLSNDILFYDSENVLKFAPEKLRNINPSDVEEFLYRFAADRSLNYLNEQMLVYGDPRLFKNGADMFKRLTGFSSTGKPLATGSVIENIIDEKMKNLDTFNNKKFIREVIATDHKFSSKKVDHYNDGVEYDGASYISWSTSIAYNIRAGLNTKEKELLYKIQNLAFKKLKTIKTKEESKEALNEIFNVLHKEALNYLQESYLPSLTVDYEMDSPIIIDSKLKEKKKIEEDLDSNAVELTMKLLEPQVPLKPQYMGQFIYKDYNSWLLNADNVIAMRKTAYFQLDPIIALSKFGSNYHKSLMYMESNKIDFIHTHGASKVGNDESRFVNIYNEKGEFVLDTHNIGEHETFLDWKYMKNQVEMSTKEKSETIDSTQKRKIVLSNLKVFNNDGILNEAITNENYRLAAEYILEYAKLYKRKDIHFSSKFSEKLPKLILSLGKGKPDNIKDALEDVAESLELDTSPLRDQIEQMLMSAVSSEFVSLKRPGNMAVQQPITLFEYGNREMKDDKILSSNQLKFGMYDGKFIAEIMMPLPQKYISKAFKMLENHNADLVKNKKTPLDYNLYNAVDIFNKTWGGKMQTVGLRIPNQQVSSTAPLTVKEFLLPTAANAIIVPTEIIWMSGGDFDIDKLSLYLPALSDKGRLVRTQIDGNNLIKSYMRYVNENIDKDDVATVYESKENYDKINLINYFYDKQYLSVSEIMQIGTSEMKSMFVEDENKANENIYNAIKNDKAFIEFEKLNAEEKRTNDEIYNKILELEFKLLTNRPNEMMKETSDDVFKKKEVEDPNDPKKKIDISTLGKLKDLIKKASENTKNTPQVKKAYEKLLKQLESSSTINISDIYSPVMHWTKKSHYADSKAGVGISAAGIAHQAVTQFNQMYFKSIVKRLVKDEAGNMSMIPQEVSFILAEWRLDKLSDEANMDIMENLSIILSSQVDAGKDPYANLMGINTKTLGAFTTMIRFGIDFYSAILLLNQPTVKKHVEKLERAASILDSKITNDSVRLDEQTIIENFLDSGLKDTFVGDITDILEKHIENPNEIYIFNKDLYESSKGKDGFYTPEQLDTVMLGIFVIFKNTSTDLIKHSRLHNSDTQRIKNEFEYLQITNTEPTNRLYSEKPLFDGESTNTSLAMQNLTTHKGRKYYRMVTDLNKYNNPSIIEIVNIFPSNLKERMYNTIRNDFMAYVVSNDPSMKERFEKHDNLEMFREINNHRDNGFIKNMFIANLGNQYILKDGIQNNMTLDINYLSGEFLLLPDKLQESIALQVLKQSAFNPGPYSLFRILPYENSLMQEAGQIYRSYTNEELDAKFTDFIYQDFWLNNRKFAIDDMDMNMFTQEEYSKIQNKIANIGYKISSSVIGGLYYENSVNYTGTYYKKPYDNATIRGISKVVRKPKFVYEDLFGVGEIQSNVENTIEDKKTIVLNKGQKEALDKFTTFLDNRKNKFFLLKGRAGTGKTTIASTMMQVAKKKGYNIFATAISDAATSNLSTLSNNTPDANIEIYNFASMYGLVPQYDSAGNQTGFDFPSDNSQNSIEPKIYDSENVILIFDEASMVSQDVLAKMKRLTPSITVLYMGDNAQIMPIGDTKISTVFELSDQFELTEVMRQKDDSPILDIANGIAKEIDQYDKTGELSLSPILSKVYTDFNKSKNSGSIITNSKESFINEAVADFKIYGNKQTLVVTGNNNNVELLNKEIREKIVPSDEQFVIGERLMTYSKYSKYMGKNKPKVEIFNSSVVTILSVTPSNVEGVPTNELLVEYIDDKGKTKQTYMNVIHRSNIEDKNKFFENKKKHDAEYNRTKDRSILDKLTPYRQTVLVDYAYAMTAHKAQGQTVRNTYVLPEYRGFSAIESRRMFYTSITRPTDKLVLFDEKADTNIIQNKVQSIVTEAEKIEIREFYLKHKDTTLKDVTQDDINKLINQGLSGEFILNQLKECKA